jgi:tetratricopeptide (TPR) repeat protein
MRRFFLQLTSILILHSGVSAAAFPWGSTVESVAPLIVRQDYASANAFLDSIIKHDPGNLDARFMKQNVLLTQMADYESYEIAGKRCVDAADTLLSLLESTMETVHGNDSARYLYFIGSTYGVKSLVLAKTGGILQGVAEAGKSKKKMEEVRALNPALSDALYGIGLYEHYVGDYFKWVPGFARRAREGLDDLRCAADNGSPFCFAAKNSLAWILYEAKAYSGADSVVNPVLALYPDNTMFLQIKARIEFGRGRYKESIRLSERLLTIAMKRKPVNWVDVLSGYQLIAAAYTQTGDRLKAIETATNGLTINVPLESRQLHWVKKHREFLEDLVNQRE